MSLAAPSGLPSPPAAGTVARPAPPDGIDRVLPTTLRDWDHFRILRRSMERFFEPGGTCWVVVPEAEHAELASRIEDACHRVIPETKVVPELLLFRRIRGWDRQQLIKLAMADWVDTDLYLTLDSDVVCTRRVTLSDLVREGRAPTRVSTESVFASWYDDAQRVLGLQLPRRGVIHDVTPAVLHRGAVHELQGHLTRRFGQLPARAWLDIASRFGRRLARGLWPLPLARWRLLLARSLPWTEYSLYYSFLEATGRFDRYHYLAHSSLYAPSGGSIWYAEDVPSWNPDPQFEGAGPPFFLVAQSTFADPAAVWTRVARHLG